MSTALYRRYRPETFAEVIGQDHVTAPLMQALRSGRVNHAYLFSGPRGCGKTTSARILARTLNCARNTPDDPLDTPCGECPSCVELARGGPGSLDVVEIDAASHNGVDDARELRERAAFAPARDRYKIFILDEAHMVTPQGFNALLKLVEEPPEHVKFVFATTEPDKVIGTIRSRTHHYPFRLVPPDVLGPYLEELCAAEGVTIGGGVVPLVTRAGGGSVRDSLSVMDQLIAGAQDGAVEYERAVALLGFTHATLLDDVVDALAARDGASIFRVVDHVIATGHEPRRFVEDVLERLRDLIVIAVSGDEAQAVLRDQPADQLARMRAQAQNLGVAELSRAADLVNAALTEMTGATSPRLHLELLMARLLLPGADDGAAGFAARLDRLERGGLGAVAAVPAAVSPGAGTPAGAGAAVPDGGGRAPAATAPASGLTGAAAVRAALRPTRSTPSAPAVQPSAGAAAPTDARPAPEPAEPRAAAAVPAGTVEDERASAPGAPSAPDTPSVPNEGVVPSGTTEPARTDAAPPAVPTSSSTAETGGGPAQAVPPVEQTGTARRTGPVEPTGPAEQDHADADAATRDDAVSPTREEAAPPARAEAAPAGLAAGRPAQPTASAPSGAASPAFTTEELRRRWPEVLENLRANPVTWSLVGPNAQVAELAQGVLFLAFPSPGLARTFSSSRHIHAVQDVVYQTLGLQVRVEARLDEGGAAGAGRPSAQGPAAPAPAGPGRGPAAPGLGGTGPEPGSGGGGASVPLATVGALGGTVASGTATSPTALATGASAPRGAVALQERPVETGVAGGDADHRPVVDAADEAWLAGASSPSPSPEPRIDTADEAWLAGAPAEPPADLDDGPEPEPVLDHAPETRVVPAAQAPAAPAPVSPVSPAPASPAQPLRGVSAARAAIAAATTARVSRPAEASARRDAPSTVDSMDDLPSADDPDIVSTGLVGTALVVSLLDGKIIEEIQDQGV
ncbi:DNA polymerase III subunit gamma and tau [Cellulosimicrobium cellulans]|uniref:DNA polymerase III subunit gamma and tau n=1 Tax=Cellulosimicrobium cellulans TaxID=1710 RepID=UPI0020979460|nr:DNA polymerase III subunit gamma and tau [Cellulosimicrobium cellulans]MCO7274623.1 DNA polymerase III subunit gamma and tau [Cellulosimicrobium cellulans]